MNILVTGAAGFIGFHACRQLFSSKNKVYGIDSINNYYNKTLKEKRINELKRSSLAKNFFFKFYKININNKNQLQNFILSKKISHIIHLAAQPGVRYSILKPETYIKNNLSGFFNILESCKKFKIKHLIYASSSSVYGDSNFVPSREDHDLSSPLQLYAATKKANEVMAFSYSNLYKIPMTCLRFFTVYGPWGRPDMSLFIFTKKILQNKLINLHNMGNHKRDFTYVDDTVLVIKKLLNKKPKITSSKDTPHQIFNIGSGKPIKLINFIKILEKILNKKAKINFIKKQPGEVLNTFCNNKKIEKFLNLSISTKFEVGVMKFVSWYKEYYKK